MEKVELEDLIEFSKTIKVLYVEGEYKLRESAYGVFKIFFHDIHTAKNGVDGLEHFLNNRYNLIITEVDMSEMSGIEMITKIRQISKDITILIISGDKDKEHFMDLIKLGIDGYILKPVKVKQFVEVLQKVIEKFKNKQELFEYKNQLEDMVEKRTAQLIDTNKKLSQREHELEALNDSLQKKVEEEVEKNLQKEKQLFEQSKLASMGEMIGNIAHQWRQPLSVISTCVTGIQMRKELGILEDDEFTKSCDIINENTVYLSKTIDDFRNFIEGNSEKEVFEVNHTVNALLGLITTSANKFKIDIKTEVEDNLMVLGLENELLQSFMNIVNNSIEKLSEIQGIRSIYIKAFKNDEHIVIEIHDNGGGIDEAIKDKLFEPYFTTKYKAQGTGKSLGIVYKLIVEAMHGTISGSNDTYILDGHEHYGAKFTITLPAHDLDE